MQAHQRVRDAPRDPEASGSFGMVLHAYEQLDPAAVLYERARLLDPAAFRWAYYHSVVLELLGKQTAAIQALRDALRLQPGHRLAQLRLAQLLLAAGELSESRTVHQRITREHPDWAAGHFGLGQLLARDGDLAEAITRFQKVIDLGGGPVGAAHYALGVAYQRLGDAPGARRHFALFEKHKHVKPEADDPLLAAVGALMIRPDPVRARELADAGRLAEAAAEYEKLVELNPQDVASHANLVRLYGMLDQVQRAEEHYRKATAINPDFASAHLNFGVILLREKRYPEAADAFRRAIRGNPHSALGYFNLGLALERQGRTKDAVDQYRLAVRNDPNYRRAHYQLGLLLATDGDYRTAIDHLRQGVEPEAPWRLRDLAAVYVLVGEYQLAEAALQRAREEVKQLPDIRRVAVLLATIERDLRKLAEGRARKAGPPAAP